MTRLSLFGATALSLSLIVAVPALAQERGRGTAHVSGSAGMRTSGGNMGGPRMSGAPQANFRSNAQTNVGRANFAARGNTQFARGNRVAQGDRGVLGGGQLRDNRGRGFDRGAGFAVGAAAAGVATGAAIAADGYGYGPDYYGYGDDYAYDTGYYGDTGYGDTYAYDNGPAVGFDQPVAGDASYCAQRYRSFDPASGTYLGFDGLRHPCP